MAKLLDLYALIDESVSKLDELLAARSADEVLGDYYLRSAVLHILQVAVQALVDVGSHPLSEVGARPPSRYGEIPALLEGLGALSGEDASLMRRMIGSRNVVVRGHSRVSLRIVGRILAERRYRDVRSLAGRVLSYARRVGADCG